MPAKKPVKTTVRRTVKKYLTVKNAVIGAIVIGVVILLTVGWGIREFKRVNNGYIQMDKKLEKVSDEQKKIIDVDRIRDSALYERISKNNTERQKAVSTIQTQKDERIKKIFSPDFSNNDDSIRAAFSNQ